MEETRDIKLERSMKLDFIDEVHTIPGGERIIDCIQCGTCSGVCPTSYLMDHPPRKLVAMIRAGMREEVLGSDALWLCASCYMCTERCPREIMVTDIIYALKRAAIKEGRYPKGTKAQQLSRAFVDIVNQYGRNHEAALLGRYFLRADPGRLVREIPMGVKLWSQGRFPVAAEKIKNRESLRSIIAKAEELGEV